MFFETRRGRCLAWFWCVSALLRMRACLVLRFRVPVFEERVLDPFAAAAALMDG